MKLKSGECPLLESVSPQRNELTLLLKVHLIGSTWRIHFRSAIGVKFFDERNIPEYWHINVEVIPSDKICAVSRVQQGGWSTQLWQEPKIRELIHDGVAEYVVNGKYFCTAILSFERSGNWLIRADGSQ